MQAGCSSHVHLCCLLLQLPRNLVQAQNGAPTLPHAKFIEPNEKFAPSQLNTECPPTQRGYSRKTQRNPWEQFPPYPFGSQRLSPITTRICPLTRQESVHSPPGYQPGHCAYPHIHRCTQRRHPPSPNGRLRGVGAQQDHVRAGQPLGAESGLFPRKAPSAARHLTSPERAGNWSEPGWKAWRNVRTRA